MSQRDYRIQTVIASIQLDQDYHPALSKHPRGRPQ
jgi:hypothetical protein